MSVYDVITCFYFFNQMCPLLPTAVQYEQLNNICYINNKNIISSV